MSAVQHGSGPPAPPSAWVVRFLPGCLAAGDPNGEPVRRQMLDVACGGGRHLRYGLGLGLAVTGVDRDLGGVADLAAHPDVTLIAADLEAENRKSLAGLLTGRRFAAVVVTNYLWRPLLADLVAAVADDGLFVYETFALGQHRFGRPSNPDFLLKPNELLDVVRPSLTVIAYEHGQLKDHDRTRIVQRIAACGPDHPWALTGCVGVPLSV